MLLRVSACVLALSASLSAQTVLYQTAFDDSVGWTGIGFSSNCDWNLDAVPALYNGFRSAPYSLNCNDQWGSGYQFCSNKTASSPEIDLSAAAGSPVTLRYWCAYHVEEVDCSYDTRRLRITNSGGTKLEQCFLEVDCGTNPSGWHEHVVALDPSWGTIKVNFYFDIFDFLWTNSQPGWFVDDMSVQTECGATGYCEPKVNSLGCTPVIYSTGSPSLTGAGGAFRIQASSVLSNHPGILIWSRDRAATAFGGGTLCLAPPIVRTGLQFAGGNPPPPDCSGSYTFQFTPELMQQNLLNAGDIVYTQYWSRDNGFTPPNNIGLTAGLQFTICP
jgi:hypothetical protein